MLYLCWFLEYVPDSAQNMQWTENVPNVTFVKLSLMSSHSNEALIPLCSYTMLFIDNNKNKHLNGFQFAK